MHNFYTHLYNKTVFELLQTERGPNEAVLFARSATAGGQQFPVHWGGDCTATFESMAESLRGGLSLSLSGFGFWSHDIGGFEQTASADVYKRWIAFGLLSSHSRLHGSSSYRVPWLYDDEAVEVLRYFTKLKCQLMPYLFETAVQAQQHGLPTLRAMLLEFPDDPACDYLDRQYMLGQSLLVAPIFSHDNSVDYYLPAGDWTHFLTGEQVSGGRWQREMHDFMSLPLFARPNSIIPVGKQDSRPDYDFADGVTFHIFALDDATAVSSTVPTLQGTPSLILQAVREGGKIMVDVSNAAGTAANWQVLLRGVTAVASVAGGTLEETEQGVLLSPAVGSDRLIVELHS